MATKALIPLADYDAACDAIRDKLHEQDTYLSGQLASKIESIQVPGLGLDQDWEYGEYEFDINACPDDCKTAWVRPSTWPNLDALTLNPEEVYLTVRNIEESDCVGFSATCQNSTDQYQVEIGTIVDGTWTVLEATTSYASAFQYTRKYNSAWPNYIVYKISTGNGVTIKNFGYCRVKGLDDSSYISAACTRVMERYAYLPHLVSTSAPSSGTFYNYNTYREYWKGITNVFTSAASMFYCEARLRKFDFVNCDFSAVTSFSGAFQHCRNMTSIDLRGLNLSKNRAITTSTYNMFSSCYALKTILTDSTMEIKSSDAYYMFGDDMSIEELDLTWLNLAECTRTQNMFNNCYNLKDVTFGTQTWTSAMTCHQMFTGCFSLQHIDLSHVTCNAITSMQQMFYNCYQLQEVDLSLITTPNVTSFASMFAYCYALKSVKMPGFNPSLATTMNSMFYSCQSLEDVDLGSVSANHAATLCTDANLMFYDCGRLKSLTLDGLDFRTMTSWRGAFAYCRSLEYLSLKGLNLLLCTSLTHTGSSYQPLFQECSSLKEVHLDGMNPNASGNFYYRTSASASVYYNIFYDSRYLETITFNDVTSSSLTSLTWLGTNTDRTNLNLKKVEMKNLSCTSASISFSGLFSGAMNLKEVDFTGTHATKPTSVGSMFINCYALKTIKGLNDIDYTACTGASNMFQNCWSLEEVDLNVARFTVTTSLSQMFYNCYSLKSLDLTNLTIGSACTNIASMFNGCRSMESINLGTFAGGSACTNWSAMFANCYNLKTILWPQVDTTYCTNMSSMFSSCWNLTTVDFSRFNTARVTTYQGMFASCRSIENLDLHKFTLSNSCTSLQSMFDNCWNVKSIDLSGMGSSTGVTTAYCMFYLCYSLNDLDISNLSLPNCTNYGSMFNGCHSFRTLDVSNLKFGNATSMGSFSSGYNIESFTLGDEARVFTSAQNFSPNTITVMDMHLGPHNYSTSISGCENLNRSALLDIINNLPTVSTQMTLTIGAGNIAKLTASERSTLLSTKNWKLA